MTIRRTTTVNRAASAAVVLLATLLAPAPSYAVAPDAAAAPQARTADPRTRLTFTVAGCEGCRVRLTSALGTYAEADAGLVDIWTSHERVVEDGSVTFTMATRRTAALSATVVAPWEGHTGYLTTVAWRYNGKRVGDPVTLEEAVTRTKASACWEGTRRREVTLPLVVERVRVRGVKKMVPGSIAYLPTTQPWLRPVRQVWDGVLGSQDVNICH
ncbi:MAG: hypothetical protein ACKOVB_23195 [Terrabacter sp.]